MSFSAQVKQDISQINIFKDDKQIEAELTGYLITTNSSIYKNKVRFSTENEYNINRFNKLLNRLKIDYTIEMQGNNYVIIFKKVDVLSSIALEQNYMKIQNVARIEQSEMLVKALVRGSFLGAGSISNPNKTYHLEIVFSCKENAEYIKEVIKMYDIDCKLLNRGKNYSIYIKEGEEISKFLALIGASSAVLKFEEIRVVKDMRNNVNRIVNCETANLNKTVTTAVRQIEDIKTIKKAGKFESMPEGLQEIAILREQNPDASLAELGNMLANPLGKSGVNHRLKKIEEYAEELK